VLDPAARRHGRRPELVERLRRLRAGAPAPAPAVPVAAEPAPPVATARGADPATVAALEARLREAGPALLSEAQLGDDLAALRTLRDDGRAVRVSGRLYAHADTVHDVTARLLAALEAEGALTLAQARDALGLSRKTAQAFLEHLDARRLTRRLPDDRRVLARGAAR
jgi:selenocysteine-specific elongation factor